MKVSALDKDRALARTIVKRQNQQFFGDRCRALLILACDFSAEAKTMRERNQWHKVGGCLSDAIAYSKGDRTMEVEA
jgi:hypothetical protein